MSERSELEREVRITARAQKPIVFCDNPVNIKGIPWEIMEEIGELLIRMFSPFFELSARSLGSGGDSAADTLNTLTASDSINPAMISTFSQNAGEAVRKLIEAGSDADWNDVKKNDFSVVIELAFEVLKYNFGPSLRKNLQSGVIEIIDALIPSTPKSDSTGSKPSSSETVIDPET